MKSERFSWVAMFVSLSVEYSWRILAAAEGVCLLALHDKMQTAW